jgi:hypothetical protein
MQNLDVRLVVKHTFLQLVPNQLANKDEMLGIRRKLGRASTEPLYMGDFEEELPASEDQVDYISHTCQQWQSPGKLWAKLRNVWRICGKSGKLRALSQVKEGAEQQDELCTSYDALYRGIRQATYCAPEDAFEVFGDREEGLSVSEDQVGYMSHDSQQWQSPGKLWAKLRNVWRVCGNSGKPRACLQAKHTKCLAAYALSVRRGMQERKRRIEHVERTASSAKFIISNTFIDVDENHIAAQPSPSSRARSTPPRMQSGELGRVPLAQRKASLGSDGEAVLASESNLFTAEVVEIQSSHDAATAGHQASGIEVAQVNITGAQARNDFLASLSGSLFKKTEAKTARQIDEDNLASNVRTKQAASQMPCPAQVHPVHYLDNQQPVVLQPNAKFASPSLLGGKMESLQDVSFRKHATLEYKDDAHTTVMLKNIPNSYTRKMLLEMLDSKGFAGSYDFVYLPVDFQRVACLGYAFVNCTSAPSARLMWHAFSGFDQWVNPSPKICEVCWGEPLYGLKALVDRYRNSPVMHEVVPDSYKPVLFKDGMRIRFPSPTKVLRPPPFFTA